MRLYASYHGMAEKETSVPEDEHHKRTEVNIFKISSFPTDDALMMRSKLRNQSKIDNSFNKNTKYHDRYLD